MNPKQCNQCDMTVSNSNHLTIYIRINIGEVTNKQRHSGEERFNPGGSPRCESSHDHANAVIVVKLSHETSFLWTDQGNKASLHKIYKLTSLSAVHKIYFANLWHRHTDFISLCEVIAYHIYLGEVFSRNDLLQVTNIYERQP